MARKDIDVILARGEELALEIKSHVPITTKNVQFRADLAGLFVVAMAATYESCVKEILMNYSYRHHVQFGNFTQNQFSRLNSKIRLSDLYKYARTFDEHVHNRFGTMLAKRKKIIYNRTGQDILRSYDNILKWRHDFAHAGIRNTTLEEASSTHIFAKRVLYAFDNAFADKPK